MSISKNEDSRLTAWALEQGCSFYSSNVAIHPSYGGYGLFNSVSTNATYHNDSERVAVCIPNSLIISIDTISEEANESDELADVLNSLPPIPTLEPILTIFLLYQLFLRRTGKQNKWSTYIDHLPKSTLLPITWNDSEIEFLVQSNSTISRAVVAKLSSLERIYVHLRDMPGWLEHISKDDYILAESWVASRTIGDPRTDTPILVPILDMANHSQNRTAAWEVTDDGIELRREPGSIAAGQELTISYDLDRGTGERLYRYGFIEDPNVQICTKGFTLFGPVSSAVPGGHIFQFTFASVQNSFRDLSFLTYENW
jgi:hypothetical protein